MNEKCLIDALKFIANHHKGEETSVEERDEMIRQAREALLKVGITNIDWIRND